ncbi:MAG: radical SAM protein, partial [Candidatus Thermoplasmatota archaeon]|nr:radical SAM protein [Candidatus Thermoplasmatota archaeon]
MVTKAPLFHRIKMGLAYRPYFSFYGLMYFRSWLRNEKIHLFDGKIRINSFIPPWPSVAHKRLLHAAFSKERIPFQVYYAVTGKCPCHCVHCSYLKRTGIELSASESLGFIDQVKQLGCSLIGFTGGEPLLRKDLESMISFCKPELATVLFTTGHGLTVKRAQALKQADLDWFTVGFESANEKKHDVIRKYPGSFQKAVDAIHRAQDAGLYTAISTVASKSKVNQGEIERLYDFAKDHNIGEFRIIPYVATGGGVGKTEEMLSFKEYDYLTSFHKKMNKKK